MARNGWFMLKALSRGDELQVQRLVCFDKCAAAYMEFDLLQVKQSREDTQWSACMCVCLSVCHD